MEAFFIHIAHKLEGIRFGTKPANKIIDVQELKSVGLWRAVFAEFIGQILFLFLVSCSAIYVTGSTATDTKLIKISLTFGFAIMGLIETIGHISGGHLNPAVTIAMAVARNISLPRCILYVIAQCLGAIVGAYIAKGLTPDDYHSQGFVATSLATGVTAAQGFGIEFMLTFVLVIVVFGTTDSNKVSFGSPAVHIGLTVGLCHLSAIQYTGCAINPSRALGSAVASSVWSDHWIYWVGPILGGVCAALVYKYILNPYKGDKSMDECIEALKDDVPTYKTNKVGNNQTDQKEGPPQYKTEVSFTSDLPPINKDRGQAFMIQHPSTKAA